MDCPVTKFNQLGRLSTGSNTAQRQHKDGRTAAVGGTISLHPSPHMLTLSWARLLFSKQF